MWLAQEFRAIFSNGQIHRSEPEIDKVEKNFVESVLLCFFLADPLGALWPAVGILVEAVLLFVIIFFAGRREKNKEKRFKRN